MNTSIKIGSEVLLDEERNLKGIVTKINENFTFSARLKDGTFMHQVPMEDDETVVT